MAQPNLHYTPAEREVLLELRILTQLDELYNTLQTKDRFDGLDADLSTALIQYLHARTGRYVL